ncbi:hypothetical protein [Pseudoalteromonas luteoviolacea]|uniref:hypothetical protein n=1 Tax=Pseudoalteromonas luteoviolacea TaxID=43657 RepID=UPI001152115D|nr:hypothetical protein [Pseudoalteromonas luteoviolacea]TQF70289.1 hypothetical protein FLM44_04135 [Pseudoalteromonas luteoviolacea]
MSIASTKITFNVLIALSLTSLTACEGSANEQGNSQQSAQLASRDGYTNLMLDTPKYVVGACVEAGYPTLRDSKVYSEKESSACVRNLSHRYNADTLASATKLHWRVKVKNHEFQCTCAGYVKDLTPAK